MMGKHFLCNKFGRRGAEASERKKVCPCVILLEEETDEKVFAPKFGHSRDRGGGGGEKKKTINRERGKFGKEEEEEEEEELKHNCSHLGVLVYHIWAPGSGLSGSHCCVIQPQ
jgi:hypothetical protein